MARKANKALSHWRTLQVYRQLKLLKSPTEIVALFADDWGVSERSIRSYIEKANKKIRADFEMDRHELLLQLLHSYQHVFEQSINSKQLSNSLGALNGIARITRIDPAADRGN